jgi:hypothetical protein
MIIQLYGITFVQPEYLDSVNNKRAPMNLRQQIIDSQIDATADALGIDGAAAFVRLVHSLVVGDSIHAFDSDDLVDGGGDKQLDAITIVDRGGSADVYILQVKNTESFSSNALIQMGNGLQWVFERPRSQLNTLGNQALQDKIAEYRSVQSSLGPANLRVHVAFVTNGLTANMSPEFRQELEGIESRFAGGTFESFAIKAYGADELVALLNAQERKARKIDADLRIRYDANTPSLIRYHAQGLKGFVCTVSAKEIAEMVNSDPEGAVFDLNLRRFLGERGPVNQDIFATCTSPATSYEFWFLNNGITIVCDDADAVTDPDDPRLKLKNLQIVNGCQTATTLAVAAKAGTLAPDVRVLLRVYETSSEDLVGRIVLTTNNQNKISSRDLRANDPVQLDMEAAFRSRGYEYERKARQYAGSDVNSECILPNELVAQWYLAVVLKNPADARGRKYKVWDEHYSAIFAGDTIEPYIYAALLGRVAEQWLTATGKKKDKNDVRRMVAKRGAFHLGRIASFLWQGEEVPRNAGHGIDAAIKVLESSPGKLDAYFTKAFSLLVRILRKDEQLVEDIDRALKSYALDAEIDRTLHAGRRRAPPAKKRTAALSKRTARRR